MKLFYRNKKELNLSQCRQFNDIKIERIFDQIQNSPFFLSVLKKHKKILIIFNDFFKFLSYNFFRK